MPIGCPPKLLVHAPSAKDLCFGLTNMQNLIFDYARRTAPLLAYVTAPSLLGVHHKNDKAMDFGGDLKELFKWFIKSKESFSGGVGFGIGEFGYEAQNHLHLDLNPRKLSWIEIALKPDGTFVYVDNKDFVHVEKFTPTGKEVISKTYNAGEFSRIFNDIAKKLEVEIPTSTFASTVIGAAVGYVGFENKIRGLGIGGLLGYALGRARWWFF